MLLDIKDIIKRQEKGYMRSNINTPAIYFTPRPVYIMFDETPMTWEEIQIRRDKINYALNWAKIRNSCYFKFREIEYKVKFSIY